ncbi:MAG: class I SAM-dependent methyltransferase [Spirochaetales bacterium]|nr:class I SAM-dependent methyltransferase [Spirochaetales bacterium]
MTNQEKYNFLYKLTDKPEVWSEYTAYDLWADEHISQKMLAYHLDPDSEPASRPHGFIDKSAAWIAERFNFRTGAKVVDFGCGPGLYTSRFHDAGAEVTGIDFSSRSIEYAKNAASKEGRKINYIQGNYLEADTPAGFDLATMIYCDYCALSPAQRKRLLGRMNNILKADGKIFLDVFSIKAFDSREEASILNRNFMDGFWSSSEYTCLCQSWKYMEQRVMLYKYDIFEAERTRSIFNWLQYFNLDTLENEMRENGFRVIETCSDAAGGTYSEDSQTIAVVVEKA